MGSVRSPSRPHTVSTSILPIGCSTSLIQVQGVSTKRYFSDFLSYFSSRGRILLFHMCFGIRISSPFHLATQTIHFQNLKCPKNAKNACLEIKNHRKIQDNWGWIIFQIDSMNMEYSSMNVECSSMNAECIIYQHPTSAIFIKILL